MFLIDFCYGNSLRFSNYTKKVYIYKNDRFGIRFWMGLYVAMEVSALKINRITKEHRHQDRQKQNYSISIVHIVLTYLIVLRWDFNEYQFPFIYSSQWISKWSSWIISHCHWNGTLVLLQLFKRKLVHFLVFEIIFDNIIALSKTFNSLNWNWPINKNDSIKRLIYMISYFFLFFFIS